MTKTAEKPYPLGPHIQVYISHIGGYASLSPWGPKKGNKRIILLFLQLHSERYFDS